MDRHQFVYHLSLLSVPGDNKVYAIQLPFFRVNGWRSHSDYFGARLITISEASVTGTPRM